MKEIIDKQGLAQVSDESTIKTHVEKVLAEATEQLEQYRSGKTKVRQFFFGKVMKATGGKADPKIVNKILDDLLPAPNSES